MKRILLLVSVVTIAVLNCFAVEKKDTTGIELDEIVVKARKEIRSRDHVSLYLSKENVEFGSNALDAISSLNRFTTSLNNADLLSNERKPVMVLINGVPSSADELRTYRADQINRVDYYEIPPVKYRNFGNGPMVDVRIRKVHDMMVSAYLNTSNTVTAPREDNLLNLSVADSLNMVRIGYGIYYDHYDKITSKTKYDYGDKSYTLQNGEDNLHHMVMQNVNASYQRSQGSNLFNARLRYGWRSAREQRPYDIVIGENGTIFQGMGGRDTRQWNDNLSLDLYYGRELSGGQSININVVGGYGKSGDRGHLFHDMPSEWDNLDYDISTRTDNRTFSLIGYAGYARHMLGGEFSASLRYGREQLKRFTEDGNIFHSLSDKGSARVGMSWYGQYYLVIPSVGASLVHTDFESVENTSLLPSFDIYAQLRGRGVLRYFMAALLGQIEQNGASISSSIDNVSYIDRRFIYKGNPELKPEVTYNANLTFTYYSPEGRNYALLSVMSRYTHHPAVPLLYREGDLAVRQLNTINHQWVNHMYLSGKYAPLRWLAFQPYVEYFNWRYDTPSNHISRNYWRFGGGVIFTPGNWNIMLAANSATKEYTGDLLFRGSVQYAVIAMYKLRNWTFGAEWHYSAQNDYTMGACEGFNFKNASWNRQRKLDFQVDIIWSFSKGYSRRHPDKKINNAIEESGLDAGTRIKRY